MFYKQRGRPESPPSVSASTLERAAQICIYVADGHPLFIAGISNQMAQHDHIVLAGSALTWDEAVHDLAHLAPDLVMVGDSLAESHGAVLAALVARGSASPRIVFLTNSVETAGVYEAMAAGAAGYLTRDVSPEVLVDAIGDVCGGRTVLSPALQTQLAEEIRLRAMGANVPVSARERRILQLIADGTRTTQIAEALQVSHATVRGDVSSILVKFGVRDRAAAVATGFRRRMLA